MEAMSATREIVGRRSGDRLDVRKMDMALDYFASRAGASLCG